MMVWCRMAFIALRLVWPHVLTPWRSPLVRWRIETYGVLDERGRILHAQGLTPRRCLLFFLCSRLALLRFLRWAALL